MFLLGMSRQSCSCEWCHAVFWPKFIILAFLEAMSSTMDNANEVEADETGVPKAWQSLSLPIEGPLQKRPRFNLDPPVRSSIKWVCHPITLEHIPFALKGDTKIIHCGLHQMKVKRNAMGKHVVECLSGCNLSDRQCAEECLRTCHILETYLKNE